MSISLYIYIYYMCVCVFLIYAYLPSVYIFMYIDTRNAFGIHTSNLHNIISFPLPGLKAHRSHSSQGFNKQCGRRITPHKATVKVPLRLAPWW